MSMQQQQQVQLGNRGYHLFVSDYNGEPKVQIRKIYKDKVNGRSIITRYGTSLSVEEWNGIKQNFQTIDQQLMNLSRQANARREEICTASPNVSGGQTSNTEKRNVEDMLLMMKEQLSKLR